MLFGESYALGFHERIHGLGKKLMGEITLMTGPFRYEGRRLAHARARLFEDRLVFSGMGWTGPHRRFVPLADVASVEWIDGVRDRRTANLVLTLHDGETIRVWIRSAGLWKFKIEELMPKLKPHATPPKKALDPAA